MMLIEHDDITGTCRCRQNDAHDSRNPGKGILEFKYHMDQDKLGYTTDRKRVQLLAYCYIYETNGGHLSNHTLEFEEQTITIPSRLNTVWNGTNPNHCGIRQKPMLKNKFAIR